MLRYIQYYDNMKLVTLKKGLMVFFTIVLTATGFTQVDTVAFDSTDMESATLKQLVFDRPGALPDGCTKTIKKADLYLAFNLGETYDYGENSFATSVDVSIKGYDAFSGGNIVTADTISFSIDETKPEQIFYRNFTSDYDGIYRFDVQIVGSYVPNSLVGDSLQLVAYYVEEFGYDVQSSTTKISDLSTTDLSGSNQYQFDWENSNCGYFPNYEIQILRLYNIDTLKTTDSSNIYAEIDWKKALSIETQSSDSSIILTLAEGTGYYVWRVRPIGTFYEGGIANDQNWGMWSDHTDYEQGDTKEITTDAGIDFLFFYTQFDGDLNWIYSRTFTEGKLSDNKQVRIAENITYANGLQQVRQTQAHLSSSNNILTTQTVYDYAGRPALSSMPVPLMGETSLGFEKDFMLETTGNPYSAADFDSLHNYNDPTPVKDASGEHFSYYSNDNSDVNIPNAEQFPFTRTLFYNDGNSRVKEQSGVGETFRIQPILDDSKTNKTYYAGIAEEELIRIFGDEAPSDKSTHKVVNIDGNGTATVTYIGKDGKTLATALVINGRNSYDSTNTALMGLESQLVATVNIADTLTTYTRPDTYESQTTKSRYFAEETTVELNYELTPNIVKDLCANYCASCDYFVEIMVHNVEQTDSVYFFKDTLIPPAFLCDSTTKFTYSTSVTVAGPGTYFFTKKIRANNIDPTTITSADTARVDSIGKRFLNIHMDSLQTYYDTLIYGQGGQLDTINGYLDSADIVGLYAHLDVDTETDTIAYIPIGCDSISIPVIVCEPKSCPPDSSFALYFVNYWQDSTQYLGKTGDDYHFLDTNYTTARFDTMVSYMLRDTAHAYTCDDLWDCWRQVTITYGRMKALYDSQGKTYSLVDVFLDCAGREIKGIETTTAFGENIYDFGYLSHAYKVFYYDGTDTLCEQYFIEEEYGLTYPDSTCKYDVGTPSNSFSCFADSTWSMFYLCSVNLNLDYLNDSMSNPAFAATALSDTCELYCEEKKAGFISSIIDGIHQKQQYVGANPDTSETALYPYLGDVYALEYDSTLLRYEFNDLDTLDLDTVTTSFIDWMEVECMADALVENCKNGCVLTAVYDSTGGDTTLVGLGTAAEQDAFEKSFTWAYEIEMMEGDSCRAGFDTIVGSPTNPYTNDSTMMADVISFWKETISYGFQNKVATSSSRLKYFHHFMRSNFSSGNDYFRYEKIYPFSYDGGKFEAFASLTWDTTGLAAGDSTGQILQLYVGIADACNNLTTTASCDFSQNTSCTDNLIVAATISASPEIEDSPKWPFDADSTVFGYFGGIQNKLLYDDYSDPNDTSVTFYIDSIFTVTYDTTTKKMDLYSNLGDSVQFFDWENSHYTNIDVTIDFGDDKGTNTISHSNAINLVDSMSNSAANCDNSSCGVCFRWAPFEEIFDTIQDSDVHVFLPYTCEELAADHIKNKIDYEINDYLNANLETAKIKAFENDYKSTCADPDSINDLFWLTYPLGIHHYTLYYYNRAGSLIKTVPPQGVDLLDRNNPDDGYDNIGQNRMTSPSHNYVTDYKYNSLGQLVEQTTPDGGTTNFYYNGLGQLRFSQNAQQLEDTLYSYTKYDNLGRIIEVGESNQNGASQAYLANIETATYPTTGLEEVTTTVYSTPAVITYLNGNAQRYLLNRISYVYTDEDGLSSTTDDRIYTYYSYDPHGNVEWLVQDLIGFLDKQYVRYEYDLVSGNVLKVCYNENLIDQFYHQYSYDADNRIILAETSVDNVIWDKDANYEYYAHGPLKRTIIGEDGVQGLDYVYTIHGWLKGINHATLETAKDPSEDGDISVNHVGKDAFGMQLSYFIDDFKRTTSFYNSSSPTYNLDPAANRSLYNGNISTWTSQTMLYPTEEDYEYQGLTGYSLRYDELNRIKTADFDTSNGTAFTNIPDYGTVYDYDANGNLWSLNRKGNSTGGLNMDDLTYHYYNAEGTLETAKSDSIPEFPTNKLAYVEDGDGSVYGTDLDDQASGNYDYDAIGNLIKDTKEEILTIKWTVYGKVKKVIRTDASTKADLEFVYDASGNRIAKIVKPDGSSAENGGSDPEQWTTTHYSRDASGNVMAIYKSTNTSEEWGYTESIVLEEQPIYGSSRIGERKETGTPILVREINHSDTAAATATLFGVTTLTENTHMLVGIQQSPNNTTCSENCFLVQEEAAIREVDIPTSTVSGLKSRSWSSIQGKNVCVAEDINGNILFTANTVLSLAMYSSESSPAPNPNVCVVRDANNNVMSIPLEDPIKSNWKGKSLAIKKGVIDDELIYYLITVGTDQKAYYHEVNVTTKKITSVNKELDPGGTGYGYGMAAIKDETGMASSYLYLRKYNGNQTASIVSFTIGETGIGAPTILSTFSSEDKWGQGEIQVSPDASKLAIANINKSFGGWGLCNSELKIYDLSEDHSSIALSVTKKADWARVNTLDFSPSSENIYYDKIPVVSVFPPVPLPLWIKKYNLSANTDTTILGIGVGEVRRGKDGKMYVAKGGESVLQVIKNPDTSPSADTPLNMTADSWAITGGLSLQVHRICITPGSELHDRDLENKRYELTDHLGNVRAVFSDIKLSTASVGVAPHDFEADLLASNNYYAFGSLQPDRYRGSGEYRFGFNGQEKDDEVNEVVGSSYTAEYWQYDSRLGRRWNVDPVVKSWLSGYSAFRNNGIIYSDPNGDDDVFTNSETGKTTIITTEDKFDRNFVNGKQQGANLDQGWGKKTYGEEARTIDLDESWNREYLYDNDKIIGLAAYKSGALWGDGTDSESPSTEFDLGIIDLGGDFKSSGFYQTFYSDFNPKSPTSSADDLKPKGSSLDGDDRGIYPDARIGFRNSTGVPFDLYMYDAPTRKRWMPKNMVWKGNTSILYKSDAGKISNLLTLKWGFVIKKYVVTHDKAKVTDSPSQFHLDNMPKSGDVTPKTER